MEMLQEQFDTLLSKGALEPVPPNAGPGFFSPNLRGSQKDGQSSPYYRYQGPKQVPEDQALQYAVCRVHQSCPSPGNVDVQH